MKNRLLFLSIILILMNKGMAQTQAKTNFLNKNRFGVGVNISTNGIGAQLAYSILKKSKLIARVESRYFYSDIKDREVTLQQKPMIVNGFIKRGSLGFMLDYHPFGNSFKITAGYALLFKEVNNIAKLRDSTEQGSIKISPDEVGYILTSYTLNPSPYFGIGFGKSVPKKRFGVSFELGFFYSGTPNFEYKTTQLLEPMSKNSISNQSFVFVDDWYYDIIPVFPKNTYSILPVLNLGLNIKLGKIKS